MEQTHTDASDDSLAGCIAIVGLAGRFPGAADPAQLWRMLRDGREATQWLTDDELRANGVGDEDLADPNYVRASLVLPGMELFDAGFFGFSKRDAAVMDPQHRHFLECAWEALEDAGHPPERFEGAIGVFGGCGMQAYLPYNLLSNPELVRSMGLFLLRHTGNDKDFLTTRASYLLDLKGPSVGVQTACSTSLVAVHLASQSLLSGECDMALAGGVSIELPHRRGYRFAEGEILSPDGHCRAFDDAAQGTLFGSGVGMVVLRRAEDALRDGDHIHALIRGSAVNNDGSGKAGYLAPSVDGQASAAVEALAVAGVEASSVDYVEAHGTGTPVGDPIEIAALSQAYGAAGPGALGIGSLKTNIGHLDTAAGVASLIKVCLALRHGLLPPSLNYSRPNSRFDSARMPFRVVDAPRPWPRVAQPRRAAVNSLGVGGTNAHVVLEEPPLQQSAPAALPWQAFTLSARTATSLEALKRKWVDFLAEPPTGFSLADAAFTTQEGRRAHAHRFSIAASDIADLREALEGRRPARVASGVLGKAAAPTALMFPGGGAHFPGAGRDLLALPAFRAAVDECLSVLPAGVPTDLRDTMFAAHGDAAAAARLEQPRYAMPALFTLEIALARQWQAWGVQPAAVIGHSAGEYAAACVAGVLSVQDGMAMVCLRGELFERAPHGGMLSVDLGEADLQPLLQGFALDIAAVNAADLCIVSGTQDELDRLQSLLRGRGVDARRLRIDVAAHSRLLDGILAEFGQRIASMRLSAPRIPFISSLTGQAVQPHELCDPQYWVRHLRQPVRFAAALRSLLDTFPDAALLETGPGQGLASLARHNGAAAGGRAIATSTGKADEREGDVAVMVAACGALWTRGAAIDWAAVRGLGPRLRVPLPTYAFDHERHWIEPGRVVRAEAAAPATAAPMRPRPLQRLPSMDDWFRVPQWQPAALAGTAGAAAGRWLVIGAALPLGAALLQSLAKQGADAIAADPADDMRALLQGLEREGRLPRHVIHLGALDVPATGEVADAQPAAFDGLLHLAQAMQALDLDAPLRLTVATAGSQAVQGPATAPRQALALGPCRVIPRELPNVRARLVDLDPGCDAAGQAQALLAEALDDDDALDLSAWRGGQRWRLARMAAAAPAQAASRLRAGGVYLITGGLGGIGFSLAGFLARTCRARLALVSRRSLPERSRWQAIAASADGSPDAATIRRLLALEEAGAKVMAYSADAADRQRMAQVISDCRMRFGSIHGVFHAAGELHDAPIAAKSPDDLRRVLGPKAGGALVLDALLPAGSLDLFAVFSSTSVDLGPPGQVDYVAANALLDALAASRPDGLAIRWGVWADTGMAARAYGRGEAAGGGRRLAHPLLGTQHDAQDGALFEADYDPARLWVLDEHRVAGRAVLPGTAYIEIARAAMAVLHPGTAVEIGSLSFEQAMVFDAGARRVQVSLRRNDGGYALLVRSRGGDDARWQEHARATVAVYEGRLVAAGRATGPWQPGEAPQGRGGPLAFGPRWNNLARMRLAQRSAVAELELPEAFAGDLGEQACHPAMTDMAATFGLHLLDAHDRAGRLFVPVTIDRIRIAAALPARLVSRVELRGQPSHGLAAFDVSLHAADGSPLATFEGFTLRGIDPAGMDAVQPQGQRHEPPLAEALLECGLRVADAPAVFERLFARDWRDVTISTVDLADVRQGMKATARPVAPPKQAAPVGTVQADAAQSGPGEVETAIAQVWRELLGVDQVGHDDDFFALGGHSLAAVRLFAKIRRQFAVDLPLATLFEAPTLGRLAALVEQLREPPAEVAAAAEAPAEVPRKLSNVIPLDKRAWSPLVEICRGEAGRRPLFCVHGAGGNVLNFKVISDRLGPGQPFYGLQAQGVDGRLRPLATVEAMASQYVEALRTVDPTGPYRLAGYSAGGLIALEMAQQLSGDGAPVELLLMIDTLSPVAARTPVPLWRKLWLLRHWSLRFMLGWPGRRRRGRQIETSYALALEKLARGEPLPPELVDFHLFRNFLAAQARYEPQPYEGPMTLFKAVECETQYLQAGARLGWEQHVTGEIRVHAIGGSHFTMMNEPGVSQLVEGIRGELARLDAPPGSPSNARPAAQATPRWRRLLPG